MVTVTEALRELVHFPTAMDKEASAEEQDEADDWSAKALTPWPGSEGLLKLSCCPLSVPLMGQKCPGIPECVPRSQHRFISPGQETYIPLVESSPFPYHHFAELLNQSHRLYGRSVIIQTSRIWSLTQHLYIFFYILFIFREGKGRRKRGRETSMCGCLLHIPY